MRFPFDLKTEAEFDVLGFGTNAVDYLIRVPEYPEFDSKVEFLDYVQAAGGEVATTMVGLRRLGLVTSYIGRFGSDPEGGLGIQNLRDEGVDLRFTETVDGARTQIAFIIIDERNGERTIIWKRDQKLEFGPDEVSRSWVKNAKVFHFTPHDVAACVKLARAAKDYGAVVSIDIDNVFDGIEDLLPLVDVLISSSEFPVKFLGLNDPEQSLQEMHSRFGCALVGLTMGDQGSIIFSSGRFFRTSGCVVPGGCKDTTGAGDAFRSGLLYGLLRNESIEMSAKMANAVAALKCREVGARTALPNLRELTEILGV